jgi:hypothetical protein
MIKRLTTCLAGFALAVSAGCMTHRIGRLNLAANQSVPITPTVVKKALKAEDCTFQGFGYPSLENAMDAIQRQAPGSNALANVSIELRMDLYLLLTRVCFEVTADAVTIGAP